MNVTLPTISPSTWLAVLGDEVRLRLLRVLSEEELSVGEIAGVFQLPQSSASRHLKALAGAGLISRRSVGTSTLYTLRDDELDAPQRGVWHILRDQLAELPVTEEDDRRLGAILTERAAAKADAFVGVASEWDAVRHRLFGEGFTPPTLLGLLDPDAVVVDLGCGVGHATEAIAPFVKQVVAVDRSTAMLEAAKRRLSGHSNVKFFEAEASEIPVADASADVIVLVLVLHFIEDIPAVLRECARVLKPGGRALFVDLVPHDRREFEHEIGYAHRGFSAEQIATLLQSANLRTERYVPMPPRTDVRGPGLFVATARPVGTSGSPADQS
jgi:ArsR family transcriptional regulator